MIAGVFCVTTGLYALKVRYPTSFRIPTLFESSPTTSSRLTTTTITSARSASVTSSPTPTPSHTTMATPLPATLSQFLVDNKRRFLEDLKKDAGANWTIVMGNEAGGVEFSVSSIQR